MRIDRKKGIFIAVMILLVISIVYRLNNPFVQKTVDTLTYTGKKNTRVSPGKPAGPQKPADAVHDFFNRPRFSGKTEENLFTIYKPPDTEKREETTAGGASIMDEKELPEPEDPVAKIRNDLVSYRLYGSYQSGDARAVFLVKGKTVLVARTGDRLYGKYLIEEIRDDYIRIKARELNETIHIDTREFYNE